MAALPTLCLRSQRISVRRPSGVLGNVCRCDNERMHASTLSLATSIPTTTQSFCAIIHSLPCSFGLEAHATVRVEEDHRICPSLPDRLEAFEHFGLRSSDGRFCENRPFAHSGRFCRHKSTYKPQTTAQGRPECFRLYLWS